MTDTDSAAPDRPVQNVQADAYWMNRAIEIARRGLLAGEPPIGACLVLDGQAVSTSHNSIIGELDITAHAEMRVIREACKSLRSLSLQGAELYVTVEPCRMCLTACHYAGIETIVYGAPISAIDAITGVEVASDSSPETGFGRIKNVRGGCRQGECQALLEKWAEMSGEQKSAPDKPFDR